MRKLRHREDSSLRGKAQSQDLLQSPDSATAGPPSCSMRQSSLLPAPGCQVHPRPTRRGGRRWRGPHHCPHPRAAFPPISTEPVGPYQTTAPDKSTIGTCFARRLAAGVGHGEVGSRGSRLAAPWPGYQQPCPPPSPLAPLKFTHLIRGASFLREAARPLCPVGRLPSAWLGPCPEETMCWDTCWEKTGPQTPRAPLLSHTQTWPPCPCWWAPPQALPGHCHTQPATPGSPIPSPRLLSATIWYSVPSGQAQPPSLSHVPDRLSSGTGPVTALSPVTPSANVY